MFPLMSTRHYSITGLVISLFQLKYIRVFCAKNITMFLYEYCFAFESKIKRKPCNVESQMFGGSLKTGKSSEFYRLALSSGVWLELLENWEII